MAINGNFAVRYMVTMMTTTTMTMMMMTKLTKETWLPSALVLAALYACEDSTFRRREPTWAPRKTSHLHPIFSTHKHRLGVVFSASASCKYEHEYDNVIVGLKTKMIKPAQRNRHQVSRCNVCFKIDLFLKKRAAKHETLNSKKHRTLNNVLVYCSYNIRMALSRAHTSATVGQSTLIISKQTPGKTHPVMRGMTQPSPIAVTVLLDMTSNVNRNPNPP